MADASTSTGILNVRVVTPEGALYDDTAAFVAAPAADGEVGILPQHTPLISRLGIGVLKITEETLGGEHDVQFAVRGGFLQVLSDDVTLLVTLAAKPEDVDRAALKTEREELLVKLQHPESDEHYAELLDARRWVEAREAIAG